MKAVIITGLSGAGRSRTVNWFEDQGYYCVDNMPPALIRPFIELGRSKTETIDRVAFVTDLRGKGFFKDLESTIVDIRNNLGIELQVVFVFSPPLWLFYNIDRSKLKSVNDVTAL